MNANVLCHLIVHRDSRYVKRVLQGVDKSRIDDCNDDDVTPLYLACDRNRVDIAKILIDIGADVNKRCDAVLPLSAAIIEGHIGIVRLLVDRSADLNDRVSPALIEACIGGSKKIAEILLRSGRCDVHLKDPDDRTPLQTVVLHDGSLQFFRMLCDFGADVHQKGQLGFTVLHCAAQENRPDIISYLANRADCDINAANSNRRTPLFIACCKNHFECIRLLVAEGADVLRSDSTGASPLIVCCRQKIGSVIPAVSYLLAHGANLNEKDIYGQTPLFNAVSCGNVETVRYLLEKHHADPYIKDNKGFTPFFCAIQKQFLELAELVLKYSNEDIIDLVNIQGYTPLYYACQENLIQGCLWLLHHGADIHFRACIDGSAPLHVAAAKNRYEATKLLITAGAPISIVDNVGATPFVDACNQGSVGAVRLLLDNGVLFANEDLERINAERCLFNVVALAHYGASDANRDNQEFTEADWANRKKARLEIAGLLLANDVNVNCINDELCTPLMAACENDLPKYVRLFLRCGADMDGITAKDESTFSADVLRLLQEYRQKFAGKKRRGRSHPCVYCGSCFPGRMKKCSRCGRRYCSVICRLFHWGDHKLYCRQFKDGAEQRYENEVKTQI